VSASQFGSPHQKLHRLVHRAILLFKLIVVNHNPNAIALLFGVGVEQQNSHIAYQSHFLLLVQLEFVKIPFAL